MAAGIDNETEALQARLEQNAALIAALLKTQELLAQQRADQQHKDEHDELVLSSLVQSITFNVQAAGGKVKRKLSMDRTHDVAFRSDDDDTQPPSGVQPLALAEKVALLEQIKVSLESLQAAAERNDLDPGRQVAELQRLGDVSLSLIV
mmetsp:Transcript_4953/g.14605  ORF Transcript_4953/g.14605 Transcript_4953/m.14605 type:complete len:149 (+) Transcript_4953:32-478(+)